MTYASLGPPIPIEAPDTQPFRIDHVRELAETNGVGEVIFILTGRHDTTSPPISLILAASPVTGAITRAAHLSHPGAGYVAMRVDLLWGNVVDLVRSITLERRQACG